MPDLLRVEPSTELKFVGPFTAVVQKVLTLENVTNDLVSFKVKTTAPKRYCVRPNCGIIAPSTTVTVDVLLQPFVYDAGDKNKHKFMVQCMILKKSEQGDEALNIEAHFKEIESSDPERISDTKLKCVFVPGDGRPAGPDNDITAGEQFTAAEMIKPGTDAQHMQDAELSRVRQEIGLLREENAKLWKQATESGSGGPSVGKKPTDEGKRRNQLLLMMLGMFMGLLIGYYVAMQQMMA